VRNSSRKKRHSTERKQGSGEDTRQEDAEASSEDGQQQRANANLPAEPSNILPNKALH